MDREELPAGDAGIWFSYQDFLPFDGCAFRMCTADGEIQMRRMFTLCSALSGRSTERNPLECRNGAGRDCRCQPMLSEAERDYVRQHRN